MDYLESNFKVWNYFGSENEIRLVKLLEDQILVLKDFPRDDVVILQPSGIHENLLAVSHHWELGQLTSEVVCIFDIGNGECFYWKSKVANGLQKSLLTIPESKGNLWMDQICIPQIRELKVFKNAQIQFMGKLYSHATSVVCGPNGVGKIPDIPAYLSRAWTQQEFSFGKVTFHPHLQLSKKELIGLISNTFGNCQEISEIVDTATHHSKGLYWIRSYEEDRIRRFDKVVGDRFPELKEQVHELWEDAWRIYGEDETFERILKFRRECKWRGEILGKSAFATMFRVKCTFPQDQLFGMMGAVHYTTTKRQLNYLEVEESYKHVLENQRLPLIIGPRNRVDGDGTGCDGFLTPLTWREQTWNINLNRPNCQREATHIYHIPHTFPQLSQFGHHWKIETSIEVWKFEREGLPWLAFGIAKEKTKNIGTVFYCFQFTQTDIKKHSPTIAMLFSSELGDRNLFSPDSPCNWRFYSDFLELLEGINQTDKYKVNQSTWLIS